MAEDMLMPFCAYKPNRKYLCCTARVRCAVQALRKRAAEEGCEVVVVSAKVESELNGMPAEEAKEWLEMLGVEAGEGGGLAALIRATYKTLGLQTYFTTGKCNVVLQCNAVDITSGD